MAERRSKVPRARVDQTPEDDATTYGRVAEREAPAPRHAREAGRTEPEEARGGEAAAEVREAPEAQRAAGSAARAREGVRSWLHETFPGHEHAVTWGFVGFLVAILFFVIGFWRTLLVVLLVFAGVAFGQVLDGDPRIINTLRRIFSGDNGR